MMPELKLVLSGKKIHGLVVRLAEKISSDFEGKDLVVVGVLKGAFIFMADLVRAITQPVEVDFIGAASYGTNSYSSGRVTITKEITLDIKGKDVLLVEDIVDTGLTLTHLVSHLKSFSPRSVNICALIDKRERRETDITVDYACYVTEEGFLVGYGLDYNEQYRNLPDIYHLNI